MSLVYVGSMEQHRCHRILASLRLGGGRGPSLSNFFMAKEKLKLEEKPRYLIPRGGHFDSLSCPHYTAELIIYIGLLLLLRSSDISVLIYLFVFFTLASSARTSHSWYIKTFPNYPKDRAILIPFLY
mmetsp:Transcript_12597/g.22446  ORF Transcript_12597/g.22446 Transcript_12597/m.22446 type:complete len:127 (-) Transcript_12597:76-456(-)